MPTESIIEFPVSGLHFERDAVAVPRNAYRFAVNTRIEKQTLAQRHGVREIPLTSDEEGLVEEFRTLNWQGGIEYTPSEGQSALQFAGKGDYILAAAGGRKFTLQVLGQGEKVTAKLAEVTGGLKQAADLHQIWLGQAENFAFAGDDFGETWVWDFVNPARASAGYNVVDKDASRIPNRMRLPVYSNGRVGVVSDARAVRLGDIIHGKSLTNAADLEKFTEQTYLAEGQWFILPSNVGPVLAAYNLPTLGGNNDHGDLILEASHAVYALDTDVYPRTSWIDTPMLRLVSLEGGARGQFGHDEYNNDSIRRTLRGVESLSFNRRNPDEIRDPQLLLSEPVDDWLEDDYRPYLRFASVKMHRQVKRLYVTARPWLSGLHWQHKGFLSYNYKWKIWESLWVMNRKGRDVKQLLPMRLSGDERMFLVAGGEDHCISLFEVEPGLRQDVLLDGTRRNIESRVETRAFYSDLRKEIELSTGHLQFDKVQGEVEFEILWKSDERQGCWTSWQKGKVCQEETSHPTSKLVYVDEFPGIKVNGVQIKSSREFRFLVKWTGRAELRFFSVEYKEMEHGERRNFQDCVEDPFCCTESVYSYAYG